MDGWPIYVHVVTTAQWLPLQLESEKCPSGYHASCSVLEEQRGEICTRIMWTTVLWYSTTDSLLVEQAHLYSCTAGVGFLYMYLRMHFGPRTTCTVHANITGLASSTHHHIHVYTHLPRLCTHAHTHTASEDTRGRRHTRYSRRSVPIPRPTSTGVLPQPWLHQIQRTL